MVDVGVGPWHGQVMEAGVAVAFQPAEQPGSPSLGIGGERSTTGG
jgi:hypothetical protein